MRQSRSNLKIVQTVSVFSIIVICCISAMGQGDKPASLSGDDAIVSKHIKDPAFSAAWKLYTQGRGLEAYDAFMVIFREKPEDMVVNFALGLSARLAGKFSEASLAFERILIAMPDNNRVRLELAVTYYRLNLPGIARMHAERVLDADPPREVAANVKDLISRIKVLESEWRTVARASVSILYDSNPNAGPSSKTVSIAPIQFGSLVLDSLTVGDETLPQESFGASIAVSMLGIHELGIKGGWSSFASMRFSHTALEDADDYDTTMIGGVIGVERAGKRGNLQIPLKLESIMLSGDDFALTYGAGATYTRALNSGAHWISGISIDDRDFDGSTARDSLRITVNQGLRWRFGTRGSFLAGAAFTDESAEEDAYSSIGAEPYAAGAYRLSRKWAVNSRLSYRTASYEEKETLAPEDRDDDRLSVSAAAQYSLTPDVDLGLTYQYTQNESTFDIYDYDRDYVSLNLSWRFL